MDERLFPDPLVSGAFRVQLGETAQSWVDPERPDFLAFEYTQQIAAALDCTVLARPDDGRVRVVHVGGGGLSLPRWVEWRRPQTAQIVLEPDGDLVAEVRRKLPLRRQSGIKIREIDGRAGLAAMPDNYADAVVLDAFADASVPPELATIDWFVEVARVVRADGVALMNLTDSAPFAWARRCVAGLADTFRHVALGAEPAIFKGRRFGNLVAIASRRALPLHELTRRASGGDFPYRLIAGKELARWLGGALPFTDTDAQPSPTPTGKHFWFS